MNLAHLRTHPLGRSTGRGWRVVSKFQVFLLWFGGFHLGANLLIIAGYLSADGKPLSRLLAPGLGCVVAVLFVVQALVWSPRPEDYEAGDDS